MSLQSVRVCDHCEKSVPSDSYQPPDGWTSVKLERRGSITSRTEQFDACSAVCTAAILRREAEKLHPSDVANKTISRSAYR